MLNWVVAIIGIERSIELMQGDENEELNNTIYHTKPIKNSKGSSSTQKRILKRDETKTLRKVFSRLELDETNMKIRTRNT